MDKRTQTGLFLALFLLLCGGLILTDLRPAARLSRHVYTFSTMGTVAGFTFYTHRKDQALQANETAKTQFDQILQAANLYNKNSELSRLNASAFEKDFPCSPLMWRMLMEARYAWQFSGGAFDITVKPLMDLWGFYRKRGKAPAPGEIRQAQTKVGFDKLILNEKKRTVRFSVPGMALDLGGIAKGFALDLAAEKAAAHISCGLLDLGGNLKFLPDPPPGKKVYHVGFKDPADPENFTGEIMEVPPRFSVSTSGDYERYRIYNGIRYGHIMDPQLGYPPVKSYAVTVSCPSAMRADWLSTAIFLKGKSLAQKARKEISQCQVIIVEK